MSIDRREIAFERAIERHLLNIAGYAKADPATFDREQAIDPTAVIVLMGPVRGGGWRGRESAGNGTPE